MQRFSRTKAFPKKRCYLRSRIQTIQSLADFKRLNLSRVLFTGQITNRKLYATAKCFSFIPNSRFKGLTIIVIIHKLALSRDEELSFFCLAIPRHNHALPRRFVSSVCFSDVLTKQY